ncbi:hypothetical protein KHQ88_06020 [Mycoplasmatota bacterium]|nr:hypothetical protein KHQ88_06020 [Mycoplasmatota bacterium]
MYNFEIHKFYDVDTGLYYLQSRYYNPEIGRFINADGLLGKVGNLRNNIYSYALGNPILNTQISGYGSYEVIPTRGLGYSNYFINGSLVMLFDRKGNHRNPNRGKPGSTKRIYYPDGSLKQEREYGPDGKPLLDHDHHKGEDVGYDHDHDWDWSQEKPRQPAREPSKALAALGLVATGAALIWLTANDITGVGAADDVLIPATATAFATFVIIIFGERSEDQWME